MVTCVHVAVIRGCQPWRKKISAPLSSLPRQPGGWDNEVSEPQGGRVPSILGVKSHQELGETWEGDED